ncbi:FAD-dependent oxidoreductase [Candidatus Fermentibacteria bacterium]|nr:FAD-dependent oxidoreductase [Candidatus Fermentibacteria bacterium]
MSTGPVVAVAGGGPCGLALAWSLLRAGRAGSVIVLERKEAPGGITASFSAEGLVFDHGSHRLHARAGEEVLGLARNLLGDDLLRRPRNGRIHMEGKLVRFPPRPLELLVRLPPSFVLSFLGDLVASPFGRESGEDDFRAAMLDRCGRALSESFYFPYARKLWGLPPSELSAEQAKRRVSSGNPLAALGRTIRNLLPGASGKVFYYPRRGFGQLARAFSDRIGSMGGRVLTGTTLSAVRLTDEGLRLEMNDGSSGHSISADMLFSTIPLPDLVEMVFPQAPGEVADSARRLVYRAMVFLYVVLGQDGYSPYDAHYFPQSDLCFSRMSEPRNYSGADEPKGKTGLCFEVPCDHGGRIWKMGSDELGEKVMDDLGRTPLPLPRPASVFTRRKKAIYPVYEKGFRKYLNLVESYVNGLPGVVTLGRQGLFAHDNTHHAITMGLRAAECLLPGGKWDRGGWENLRDSFRSHVVED